ncbi:hypothetical protein BGX29_000111 [Mortierella sp. GBA35]|nr:hypothetical protein BGX29_000111 [Mortierella sp. GBA35]
MLTQQRTSSEVKETPTSLDLNGEWNLSNEDKSVQVSAMVPGQIHLDLIQANIIDNDPYYGTNYVKESMRKIIESTWTLEKTFDLGEDAKFTYAILDCEGLDTLVSITLNGVAIGSTDNQFRHYHLDMTKALQPKSNTLRIRFDNAVRLAKEKAEAYSYYVPDMFNMSAAQHGFPNRNFVRKEQCSFSWDWGPAFAPCGIWRPMSIKLDNQGLLVKTWSLLTSFNHALDTWEVQLRACVSSTREQHVRLKVHFDGGLLNTEEAFDVAVGDHTLQHSFTMEKSSAKLWWPRGYGEPNLYKLEASLLNDKGSTVSSQSFKYGFRTCNLVQKPLENGQPGDSFHFRVNGIDMFAKGANWIPGHVATSKLRGRQYEHDSDLGRRSIRNRRFACSLYPTDQQFLENVQQEVKDQVNRLKCHPSIILWSGNNENQEFMVKGWDKATVLNPYIFTIDYHRLYIETIMAAVHTVDKSRPFISTSPSAGLISEHPYTERYVLQENERGLYGDVHFYDYKHNGLHVEYYPKARFVSEYGAQSMPSFRAWKKVSSSKDWHPLSKLSIHRNHHGNGQQEMLQQIEFQFQLPSSVHDYYHSDPEASESMVTPATRSSIEHGGTWKPLHYFIKHAFSDVLVSGYQPQGEFSFDIHISNDRSVPIKGDLYVKTIAIHSGRTLFESSFAFSVKAHDSRSVTKIDAPTLLGGSSTSSSCLIVARAIVGITLVNLAVHMLPQVFPVRDALPIESCLADPKISTKVERVQETSNGPGYDIHLSIRSEAVAGLVWLEWKADDMEGHFSDNALWLLPGLSKNIIFHGTGKKPSTIADSDLQVKSLFDVVRCGRAMHEK